MEGTLRLSPEVYRERKEKQRQGTLTSSPSRKTAHLTSFTQGPEQLRFGYTLVLEGRIDMNYWADNVNDVQPRDHHALIKFLQVEKILLNERSGDADWKQALTDLQGYMEASGAQFFRIRTTHNAHFENLLNLHKNLEFSYGLLCMNAKKYSRMIARNNR